MAIQISNSTRICPFSKSLIKPHNLVWAFSMAEFIAFKKLLYQHLSILPPDIIDLIIKKTGYNKLLHRIGHEKYARWTKYTRYECQMRKLLPRNLSLAKLRLNNVINYNSEYLYNNYRNNHDTDTDYNSDYDTDTD